MRLVIIHGPPGVGKLTMARSLERMTNFKVLHNHLTFNPARVLFEIGDPRLNDLHHELRHTMIEHAAKADLDGILLTIVYSEPESIGTIKRIWNLCRKSDTQLHCVYLFCDEDELHRRVEDSDRSENKKLRSSAKLSTLLKEHDYIPIPNSEALMIDITDRDPDSTSHMIIKHFQLPSV